jgi:hypothetical protein
MSRPKLFLASPSGEREPEAGAEGVEAESPEGEDWLDAIIDEALAEGRTVRDRQRSRCVEMGD